MWRVSKHRVTRRLNLIIFAVCAAFFLIFLRFFTIQIIKHNKYNIISLNQQDNILKKTFTRRGDIFISRKDGKKLAVASTKKGFLSYINARILENPEEAFLKLNEVIDIDKEVFFKLAQKKSDPFEILKRKLSPEWAEKILALNVKGIGIIDDEWRFYPYGAFLSHVLGFSSVISDVSEGRYGIEKFYENILSVGKKTNDHRYFSSFFSSMVSVFGESSKRGGDIYLTIEPGVQTEVENELDNLFVKWHAKSGGILVLDPKSGEIIAMSAFPDFDPNKYFEEKNLNVFLNPFTEKIFEMGSVFKPITMSIAIDSGNITPTTTYVDKGFVEVGGAKLHNFDEKPRGERNMTQVLEESLNTGAVFAVQRTGKKIFKEYLRKFGFYQKTDVDLPGEVRGNLSNLESGRDVEFATASFGQGIAISPISMARALAVLANNGKLIKPVLKIEDNKIQNEERKVLKEETAFLVSKMLVDVVDHTLAGGKAKMDGYSIAAKTGTAQILDPKSGRYSDEFLHSFFGYFPAYDSKFLIFLFLEKPIGAKYSSQTLTDSFTKLVKFLINYYNVPPDR